MATNSRHSHPDQTHFELPNVIAVRLSRQNQPITTEWSFHPEVVTRIFRTWGTATVEMLHLPQFMSPISEPRALAIEALSQDWQGRSMFMFPLFPLLSKVIQKLRTTQEGEVILIGPWWPSQPWFPHLLLLLWPTLSSFCIPPGPTFTTGICLGWRVVPSACLEALMQDYQAAGFSKRSLD